MSASPRVCLLLLVLGLCDCTATSTAARAPVGAASSPVVIGQSFTLDSKVLGETRRINVYLPPGYEEADTLRFPVLYMPDGGLKEDFHHITGIVQVSVGNETMRPFIVVGIENTERRRDLTGPTDQPDDRKIAPRVGGSAAFRNFIRDELMPEIKRRYRTTNETAIVGESLAGLFVLETFFLEPALFDTYIAVSPSVWWNKQALASGATARLQQQTELNKKLYITAADEEDIIQGTVAIAASLRAAAPRGLTWFYEPLPTEHHGTIFHLAALKAFRTVFAPEKAAKAAN
jgi:predicted alpha/beta superfamily hydrolase